jgi:hypothetical protein
LLILDAKFIDGGYLAFAYKDNKESIELHIRIFETETSALIKSADFSCHYRSMIPLSNGRLIVFPTNKEAELWNLKRQTVLSIDFDLDYDSRVCLLSDRILVYDAGLAKCRYPRFPDEEYPFETYVWQINENDLRLVTQINHTSHDIVNVDLLMLDRVNENQFIMCINDRIEVWDIDGNLVFKATGMPKYSNVKKLNVVGKMFICVAILNDSEASQQCVMISSIETGELLHTFDNCAYVGSTPYEIFIRHDNIDKFDIEMHALDDEFTFVGILNTQHIYHENINSIEYCPEFQSFIFKDVFHVDFAVGLKTLNYECKLNLYFI